MDNLEQQCEDVLFELCDAREQCPFKCAAEFRKCIQLKNEIQMMNVAQKSNVIDNIVEHIPHCGSIHFNGDFNKKEVCFKHLDFKLKTITNALSNLKAVSDQIEREKICEINILLKS